MLTGNRTDFEPHKSYSTWHCSIVWIQGKIKIGRSCKAKIRTPNKYRNVARGARRSLISRHVPHCWLREIARSGCTAGRPGVNWRMVNFMKTWRALSTVESKVLVKFCCLDYCALRAEDIGRLQQKVNNRRLRQAAIVRSVRHENGRILYTKLEEWDGRYSQQKEVHN